MANNEWPCCKGKVEVGEIIEKRVNYTVEHWDIVLRRWASLASCKTLDEAEVKAASVNGQWRIVKHTGTKEVVDGE